VSENIKHDIVIIGGGAAGLSCAIEAASINPKLSIAIISKVYPTRSHTVAAEGGIAAAVGKRDSEKKHANDTIEGSDGLADKNAVDFFVHEAPKQIQKLNEWGCPWSREASGKVSVRAFGGMNEKRTVYAADKTGFYLLHTLFERTMLYPNIVRYDEWYVTRLTGKENQITGAVALHLKSGKLAAFSSKVVIIATGGAGRIYSFTTNSEIKTGDGYALALEAGAALKDMEFVQFHPTALAKNGILITEAARGEGGFLLNNKGERFMKDYSPDKMELAPRDKISRAIVNEIRENRGIPDGQGLCVHLDIRHLNRKTIEERLPMVKEIALEYANINPEKEPIPVKPAQHYFMGGIATDIECRTNLDSLLAAGEAACVSIHGANRLGSNSLAECLVFGTQAGKTAAHLAEKTKQPDSKNELAEEEKRINKIIDNRGKENIGYLRECMQDVMEKSAGIIRDQNGLEKGLIKIRELKAKSDNVSLNDSGRIFNMDLIDLLELKAMLDVSETVILSALERKESRGAHFRNDRPHKSDIDYQKHTTVKKGATALEILYEPVNK
jgi:succinate dehydrogenase/fumarate reductase flavoprotein subunit